MADNLWHPVSDPFGAFGDLTDYAVACYAVACQAVACAPRVALDWVDITTPPGEIEGETETWPEVGPIL